MGKNLLTERQVKNWKSGTSPCSSPPSKQNILNSKMSISDDDGLSLFFDKRTNKKTWRSRKKGGIFNLTDINLGGCGGQFGSP